MPAVKFVNPDETSVTVEVPEGHSLMEGAVKNNVRGIDADCGGACACATCHVYVDQEWLARLPPKEEGETCMLELAVEPADNSRLSCQIKVTKEIDGLVVRMPKSQH